MKEVTKGIIFAGSSITWGSGLYFYSNLSNLVDEQYTFKKDQVTRTHIEYAKTFRYPRLVANHFNTFEIVHPLNGGSHTSAIRYWEECFNPTLGHVDSEPAPYIDSNDIGFLIFQLTNTNRCQLMNIAGTNNISFIEAMSDTKKFKKWLTSNEHGVKTIDEYENWYKEVSITNVKQFLKKCEERGIKTGILTWPNENLKILLKDPWLKERFIHLAYKDKVYGDIETLTESNDNLKIETDYENFLKPPEDDHPSKLGHKIIATNIINYIRRRIENDGK